MPGSKNSRNRRHFSKDFKLGAVKLVTEQGYSAGEAARRLEIDRKSLWEWIKQLAPQFDAAAAGRDVPDDPQSLASELRSLRKENDQLRLENEILKKATAYFAKDQL